MKRNLRAIILPVSTIVFLIIILIYGVYRAYPLLAGPVITVYSPHNGDAVGTTTFQVTGKAERAKEIRLQGRPITINTEGVFNETLVSHSPYTILVLEAVDAYGKTTQQVVRVVP